MVPIHKRTQRRRTRTRSLREKPLKTSRPPPTRRCDWANQVVAEVFKDPTYTSPLGDGPESADTVTDLHFTFKKQNAWYARSDRLTMDPHGRLVPPAILRTCRKLRHDSLSLSYDTAPGDAKRITVMVKNFDI